MTSTAHPAWHGAYKKAADALNEAAAERNELREDNVRLGAEAARLRSENAALRVDLNRHRRGAVYTFYEYQQETEKTVAYENLNIPPLAYLALGLTGEAAELANSIKKVYRDDDGKITSERRSIILDECGDVLWYLARIVVELGVSFGAMARENIRKLSRRLAADTIRGDGDKR